MIITTALIGGIPDSALKRWINARAYIIAFRIMARSLTSVIRIYNPEYRPARGSVCVANHTTPCDVLILSTDNCYSLVSERNVEMKKLLWDLGIVAFVAFVF